MADRGVSQARIGDALGISQQQVSERLAGRVEFRAGELAVVARELRVSIADLIDPAVTT